MTYPVGSITGYIRIAGAAQATRDLASVRAEMTGAGESATRAASGFGRTDAALSASSRAASSAAGQQAKFRAAQLSAVAATERYNLVLADENASLARLAAAEASVVRANERVRATTPASVIAPVAPASDRAAGAVSRLGAGMASMGKMAAGLGVTLGVFEAAKKAIDITKEAVAFQRDMLLVQTQAGASSTQIQGFSKAILGMAGQVAQAPEDLATSLYHVYSATKTLGYTGPQMLDAVKVAAQGATISGADLEETTNALTATMVSGLGNVNNMSAAMGALNAIVGVGDMKLSDLNAALGTGILAVAKQFGVTLDQAGAALAVFGDNNIRGAKAATQLRMVIQDMTKPAANAAGVLEKIGLSTTSLRDDLQKGGLSAALNDLKKHLDAAGVTGNKVGGLIEDAFTKKAGVGLAILLNNIDQYNEKSGQIVKSSDDVGSAWQATTKTASFALNALGARVQAAGIVIAEKLTPYVATAARWLATDLPNALATLQQALAPTIRMVGSAFVAAFHGLVTVLGPVVTGLGDVGHLLSEHADLISHVITPVLTLWAAWKGYTIAVLAVHAIQDAVAAMGARLTNGVASFRSWQAGSTESMAAARAQITATEAVMQAEFAKIEASALEAAAAESRAAAVTAEGWASVVAASESASTAEVAAYNAAAVAAGEAATAAEAAAAATVAAADTMAAGLDEAGTAAAVGWKSLLGPIALAATAISVVTSLFGHNGSAAAAAAQDVQTYTEAIQQDNDALGENTRKQIEAKLAAAGWYEMALKIGISQKTLTDSLLGNKSAFNQVNAALDAARSKGGAAAGAALFLGKELAGQSAALKTAKQHADDMAAADGKLADATGKYSATAADAAIAAKRQATAARSAGSGLRWVVDSSGNLVQTTMGVAKASDKATAALQAQTRASQALKLAQDLLNGVNESLETSTDSFQIALGNLRNQTALATDKNGNYITSLKQSTVAGATNRQMITSLIDGAKAQAQATADQAAKHMALGQALKAGNAQLAQNESAILAAAKAAGLDTGQVQGLIDKEGQLSRTKASTNINSDAIAQAATRAQQLHNALAAINGETVSASVVVREQIAGAITGGGTQRHLASGGTAPSGFYTVGERGWELAHNGPSGTQIFSHGQSMAMTGLPDRLPGYASGTGGMSPMPSITTKTANGKTVYVFRGQSYDTQAQADKARADYGNQAVEKTLYGPNGSGVKGVADFLRSEVPESVKAMGMLSKAVNAAFTLKGVQREIADAKTALTDMKSLVSGVRSTVTQALGSSAAQYTGAGSVADLLTSIAGGTATNKAYSSEVRKLTKMGLDRNYLAHLQASGQTATLMTLAGASKSQIAQVNKAVSGFRGSLSGAANAAIAETGYDKRLAADQQRLDRLHADQHELVGKIDKLLVGISQITKRPVHVDISGQTIAKTVVAPELVKLVDELGHHLTYGRRH